MDNDKIITTVETMKEDKGNISDGYHTFNELYEYRLLYNASMFNELAKQGLYDVHKSKRHSDGEECFGGGWFIVQAQLPTGQISNHYEMKDWDLFQIPIKEKANPYDGHTPHDVAKRLREFLTPKPQYPKTYKECCKMLGYSGNYNMILTTDVDNKLFNALYRLKVCRDAWWKMADDWKPDYNDCTEDKYFSTKFFIYTYRNEIHFGSCELTHHLLAFPTAEMRDAFYDNFKELINEVKELL